MGLMCQLEIYLEVWMLIKKNILLLKINIQYQILYMDALDY